MKPNRLMPWVGWNTGNPSLLLLPEKGFARECKVRPLVTDDPFIEMTKEWWERFAAATDWKRAAKIGKLSAERRPDKAYGWENWAWALHKQGDTLAAYNLLAPLLKKLKLPGPPSGRAAYSLACFCGALNKIREGTRWLRLAHTLCRDKDQFHIHAVLDPDLREIWPSLPEVRAEAYSVLE